MTVKPLDPRFEDFRIAQIAYGIDDIHAAGSKTKLSQWFDEFTRSLKDLRNDPVTPPISILIRRNLSQQISTMCLPQKPVHSGWDMQQGAFTQPWNKSNIPVGRILTKMRHLEILKKNIGYPAGYVIPDEKFTTKFIAISHPHDDNKLWHLFNQLQQYSEPQKRGDLNHPSPPSAATYVSDLYQTEAPLDEFSGGPDIRTGHWRTYAEWMDLAHPSLIYDPFEL